MCVIHSLATVVELDVGSSSSRPTHINDILLLLIAVFIV